MTNQRFILGTAGHVDHGKTELVRRLTGVDTDRLKEEKARGISIELGFAPLPLGDDIMIGVVDVPGHERFVKQMVAGAGGIDMAILVVAADEGVMPQTREHLEVLRSLSVTHGVVVITKADLASDDMSELLEEEIGELIAGTFLEGAPMVRTSAKTGAGIDNLKQVLRGIAGELTPRDTNGPFRLAVDRVFLKQGIGLVVTGSCYSGTVSIGDVLQLLPSEKEVRVRELQSFAERRRQGYAGERLAVALQGRKLNEVERGEMLVTPGAFAVSYMLDARVHLASYSAFELKQRERIRFHHGAREVLGRVALLDTDTLESGGDCLVQFRLETPIVAGERDFFVIRKYSPSHVLGGGRIIDPRASKHRRKDGDAIDNLHLLERGNPTERLAAVVLAAGLAGHAVGDADPVAMAALLESGAVTDVERMLFDARVIEKLAADVYEMARMYAKRYPMRLGIDKEEVRQKLSVPHGPALFNRLLDRAAEHRSIYVRDAFVRADTADVVLSADHQRDVGRLDQMIRAAGVRFPKYDELRSQWQGKVDFDDALAYLKDRSVVVHVGDGGYLHEQALAECLDRLGKLFDEHGEVSVADFKDMFGMTRKHAIPLLEYLDDRRITTRRENVRVKGPRFDAGA